MDGINCPGVVDTQVRCLTPFTNQFYTPQSGIANGPEWAALKKHWHRTHPRINANRPFCQGPEKIEGTAVGQAFSRLNDSLKGLWAIAGRGQEAWLSTLGEPMTKGKI